MIGETEWFRKLEGEYHYMGESHGAGDLVRLVFEEEGRHDFDVADYAAHLSKWMTAQHGKLARHLAADGKFVDEVVGLVSVVDTDGGDDGGEVVWHVDMRTAPGADDGAGEERLVPPSGEARADHDERRTAMT